MTPLRIKTIQQRMAMMVGLLYCALLLLPQIFPVQAVQSLLEISEIMYDAPGTDTNQEWIEVHNISGSAIDLANWKLFEANANHSLTLVQGSSILTASEYAVLTGSGAVFLANHNGYTGNIFTTVFSLSNTGETLNLKDGTGTVMDSMTYSGVSGAAGNGYTLEKNSAGVFQESLVAGGTPGQENSVNSSSNGNENSDLGNQNLNGGTPNENGQLNENTNSLFNSNSTISDNGNDNLNGNANLQENTNFNDNTNAVTTNVNGQGNANDNFNSNSNLNNNSNDPPVLTPGSLLIHELYPRPVTGEQEWIELYNTTPETIRLEDVTLQDNTTAPQQLSGTIAGQGFLVIEPSPVSLNNDGDILTLKNNRGDILDQMQYGSFQNTGHNAPAADASQSIGRFPDGTDTNLDDQDFKIFGTPTKGLPNTVDNHRPTAVITLQSPYKTTGNAPFSLNLTGEQSSDPDGDTLTYFWEYDDGYTETSANPAAHKYLIPGSYLVRLAVTDSWGEVSTQALSVTVFAAAPSNGGVSESGSTPLVIVDGCSDTTTSKAVRISEILPNPSGVDAAEEFIELYNDGDLPLQLCNWRLDDGDGGSKPFTITKQIVLAPRSYIVFSSLETKIALNNDTDYVRLYDSAGELMQTVSYEDATEGKSYALTEQEWTWSEPTPGQRNMVNRQTILSGFVFSEIYPNPPGKDEGGEFVELINAAEESRDVQGWQIQQGKSLYTFPESVRVSPQSVFGFGLAGTKITLKNTTGSLMLLDPSGKIQDTLTYVDVPEGESLSRFINDAAEPIWEWSEPTFTLQNKRTPLVVTALPAGGEFHNSVTIELSTPKSNAEIFYTFQPQSSLEEFESYNSLVVLENSRDIWFYAETEEGERSPVFFERYVVQERKGSQEGILISELYPDPKGADNGTEWIELINNMDEPVMVQNYSFVNKNRKKLRLSAEVTLAPEERYVVKITDPKFHLTNSSDVIELYCPDGSLCDTASYGESKTGLSFVRPDAPGEVAFLPSTTATPGKINKVTSVQKKVKATKKSSKKAVTPAAILANILRSPVKTMAGLNVQFLQTGKSGAVEGTVLTSQSSGNFWVTLLLTGLLLFGTLLSGILYYFHRNKKV